MERYQGSSCPRREDAERCRLSFMQKAMLLQLDLYTKGCRASNQKARELANAVGIIWRQLIERLQYL